MHALSVYLSLVGASIRSQLKYKVSVAFDVVGYFVVFWSEFAAIWILFKHFGDLAGWKIEEVLICYGLAHLSYSLSEFLVRGFEFLAPLTRRGEYDRLLLNLYLHRELIASKGSSSNMMNRGWVCEHEE